MCWPSRTEGKLSAWNFLCVNSGNMWESLCLRSEMIPLLHFPKFAWSWAGISSAVLWLVWLKYKRDGLRWWLLSPVHWCSSGVLQCYRLLLVHPYLTPFSLTATGLSTVKSQLNFGERGHNSMVWGSEFEEFLHPFLLVKWVLKWEVAFWMYLVKLHPCQLSN